jgi:transposase-like protein
MAQHFLLSKAAKTMSLAQVFRMTDAEAETTFKMIRWADTNGTPVCPSCGSVGAYEARRPNGALRFRCKGCKKDFTITSGTLFGSHKLPLRGYLAAIAVFCNEVKGKSALAISRDLGLSYKSAFVLLIGGFFFAPKRNGPNSGEPGPSRRCQCAFGTVHHNTPIEA